MAGLRILEPRTLRIARGVTLLASALSAGIQVMAKGQGAAGAALVLGSALYICLTAVIPSVAGPLEKDDSPHHMAVAAVDLLLISAIIWLTGGTRSEYYLLYYCPIVYAALRLKVRDGIGATVLSAALYLLVAATGTSGDVVVTTGALRVLAVFTSMGIVALFFSLIRREAKAYEELRAYVHESLGRVNAVYDVAHAASAGAGLTAVASILLDQAARAIGADAGAMALVGADGELEVIAKSGPDETSVEGFSKGEAAGRRAMLDRTPVSEDRPSASPGGPTARAVYVPLLTPGGAIGYLALCSRSARKFKRNQTEFLDVLCSEAATAIENVQLRAQLSRLASTDHLTGLSNRREMERLLTTEADRAARYERPLTVMMMDVDNLKVVNDCYGHAVGDQVLCALGRVLTANLRGSDQVGRMGGDEFLAVLPETDVQGGEALAERLARGLREELATLESWAEMAAPVGLSIGVAGTTYGGTQARQLLARADEALYEAKRSGKNRASVARAVENAATAAPAMIRI